MSKSTPKPKPSVAILLSTYNSMQYIDEQLNSIFSQIGDFDLNIYIRDDGSNDGTQELLRGYEKENDNIFLTIGENLGVIGSFFWLLVNVEQHDYYAFCDQDDVWHPLKVQAALVSLEKSNFNTPSVYCGAYDYVNENLYHIGRGVSTTNGAADNLLIENCAPGCTVVFNHSLLDICRKAPLDKMSDKVVMHDWFVVLVGTLFGDFHYDNNSYIYYRQHANNVVGVNHNIVKSIIGKAKRFLTNKKRNLLIIQAETLFAHYNTKMQKEDLKVFSNLLNSKGSFITRFISLRGSKLHRNKLLDNVVFKVFYLLGLYK